MLVPFLKPPYDDKELDAVERVMRTTHLSTGQAVTRFESEFANYIGTNFAVAVNSGTSALELTLQALIQTRRISPGAGVIIPSFTFVAVANAVINAGLKPVFVDISPTTLNMNTGNLTMEKLGSDFVQAIIPVHTFGMPCDMYEIVKFASEHNLVVIEDCAEALGSTQSGYYVGSLADCAIFSFTPTKNMTTGEGGMITTNNTELAEVLRLYREHGVRPNTGTIRDAIVPGHNFRMPNILAAIGEAQLYKINMFNEARNRNAALLSMFIEEHDLPVRLPEKSLDRTYQMYAVQLMDTDQKWSATSKERDQVVSGCIARAVEAKVYFNLPIHLQTAYNERFLKPSGLPVTEAVAKRVISLPMYPGLSNDEIEYMADSFAESVREAL